MSIQIYCLKKNFDTQKAERFFKERRVPYQLMDLKKHKLGARELLLVARRLGAENLIDRKNPEAVKNQLFDCVFLHCGPTLFPPLTAFRRSGIR